MTTCSLRLARIVLLALTLGTVFAGLALAQGAPMSVDRQPGKSCAPAMSMAASKPALNPLGLSPEPVPAACHYYGTYYEWWKNGEVCRTRNTCLPPGSQYTGSCPNGYDFYTYETIVCWC